MEKIAWQQPCEKRPAEAGPFVKPWSHYRSDWTASLAGHGKSTRFHGATLRAAYTAGREVGSTFSITVPSQISMASGGNSIPAQSRQERLNGQSDGHWGIKKGLRHSGSLETSL
jgi:hypothetical protein